MNELTLPIRIPAALPVPDRQRLVAMFKAIGHPMRFDILHFLLENPSCCTKDIVDALPISQSTVSQHIKMLRQAGWIATEADCQMTLHWLDEDNIAWFQDQVRQVF
jgi:DNA-binding transcriptional ArsR family regulator